MFSNLPIQAYLIGGGMLLAFIGIIIFMFVQYRAATPKDMVEGVPVRWLPGAVQPYPGLRETILALREVLTSRYGADFAKKALDVWLEVDPAGTAVRGQTVPDGFEWSAQTADGRTVWATFEIKADSFGGPYTKIVKHPVTGTHRAEAFFGGLVIKDVVPFLQLRVGGPADVTGNLVFATHSALIHEICEHRVPTLLEHDPNYGHAPKWLALTKEVLGAATPQR